MKFCGIFEVKMHSGFVLGWLVFGSTIMSSAHSARISAGAGLTTEV